MFVKKVIICIFFIFNLIYTTYAEYNDLQNQILDRPELFKRTFPSLFSNHSPAFDFQKPSVIEKYMDRVHYKYLMNNIEESKYQEKLDKLLKDKEFTNRFHIKKSNEEESKDVKEKAAMAMGNYYLGNWTPFTIGKPKIKINIGESALDTISNILTGQIILIKIPYNSPYNTIYDAEQSYRFYLKNYPDGKYVIPALFGIAQCRIQQKDYLEAYITYKYVLRFLMEKNGFTNSSIEDEMAKQILHYTKEYEEKININFQISKMGTNNHIDSIFEFDKSNKNINISISYGRSFGNITPESNNQENQ